jgi:ABC-type proline/glycine betaine transport system permease subunit
MNISKKFALVMLTLPVIVAGIRFIYVETLSTSGVGSYLKLWGIKKSCLSYSHRGNVP